MIRAAYWVEDEEEETSESTVPELQMGMNETNAININQEEEADHQEVKIGINTASFG